MASYELEPNISSFLDVIDEMAKKEKLSAKEIHKLKKQLYNELWKQETKDRKKFLDDEQTLRINAQKKLAKLKLEAENDAVEAYNDGLIKTFNEVQAYRDALEKQSEMDALERKLREQKEIASALEKTQSETYSKLFEARKKQEQALEKIINARSGVDNKENKKKLKEAEKDLDKAKKEAQKIEKKAERAERVKEKQEEFKEKGGAFTQLIDTMKENLDFQKTKEGAAAVMQENLVNTLKGVGQAITKGLNEINNAISDYAKKQLNINTRLQGLTDFSKVSKTLGEVAFSPLLSAETLYSNVEDLINQGIAHNIEQRGFFQTIKDGIATTFDVTENYMKRIIKVQQSDSTAARLGLEAYLTRWLNEYVENTEYLTSTFDSVAERLFEASAVIGATNRGTSGSLEFESVVQGWLGTLTGVGFSESVAQEIASALGQLGSGNKDVLNSEIGMLLTMAAASTGQNIGQMLSEGLDARTTNDLLFSAVSFLKSINDTSENNVTKAEMAKIFGVSVSDLISLNNLSEAALLDIQNKSNLTYNNMFSELKAQFDALPERLGISNILENLFSNFTYQTGMSIAGNPVGYATWKITDLIQGVTGGINIPYVSALGTGVDLNTTVENLMKLGIVGVATIGNIGKIAGGFKSVGKGSTLLDRLKIQSGVEDYELKKLGSGLNNVENNKRSSSKTVSEMSSLISNSSGEDYVKSAQNIAENESQEKLTRKIKEAAQTDPVLMYLEKTVKLDSVLQQMSDNLNIIGAAAPQQTTDGKTITITTPNVKVIKTLDVNNVTTAEVTQEGDNKLVADRLTPVNSVTTNYNATNGKSYLQEINFDDGFKKLLLDVEAIKNNTARKVTEVSTNTTTSTGFQQLSYAVNTGGL